MGKWTQLASKLGSGGENYTQKGEEFIQFLFAKSETLDSCRFETKMRQNAPAPLKLRPYGAIEIRLSYLILHSLICRVLLLLLLLRHASDLINCTSYFGACMWVWYCRPPIDAHFHPTPNPTRSPAIGGKP